MGCMAQLLNPERKLQLMAAHGVVIEAHSALC
jgi:hypothetical protein